MSKIIKKSITGLKWNSLRKVGKTSLNLITTLVLVQFLLPEDFGMVAMITVFSGLYILFSDFGLGSSIVQKEKLTDLQISTAHWLSCLIGFFFMLILFFCSNAIANFYGLHELANIAKAISLSLVFAGATSIPIALITKELDFRKLCIIDLSVMFISGLIAIIAALNGFAIWSLVFLVLSNAIFRFFLIIYLSPWSPRFVFSISAIKPLIHFGFFHTSNNVLNYSVRNLDDLLIGKFLGSTELGLYSKAYSLLLMPLKNITGVFQNVLFPAFSKLQSKQNQIQDVYLKSVSGIALISFPLMIIVYFVIDELIRVFFTEEWYSIIPLVKVFCFLAMIQSVLRITSILFLAMNKTKWLFYFNLVTGVIFFIGFFIVLNDGILAIAYWWIAFSSVIGIVQILFSNYIIELNIFRYVEALSPIILISATIFCIGLLIDKHLPIYDNLGRAVVIGIILLSCYLGILLLTNNKTFKSLKNILYNSVK